MHVIWCRRDDPPSPPQCRHGLLGYERKSETFWLPEFLSAEELMDALDKAWEVHLFDTYEYEEVLWEIWRRGPFARDELEMWCGWLNHPLSRVNAPCHWPENVSPFRIETTPAHVRARVVDVRLLEESFSYRLNEDEDGVLHVWVLLQVYSDADAFAVNPTATALLKRDNEPVLRLDHEPEPLVYLPEKPSGGVDEWRWVSWVQLLTFRQLKGAPKLAVPAYSELEIGIISFSMRPLTLNVPVADGFPCEQVAEGLTVKLIDFGLGRMEPRMEANFLRTRREQDLLERYYPEHPVLDWEISLEIPEWLPEKTDTSTIFGMELLCQAGLRPRLEAVDRLGAPLACDFTATCYSSNHPKKITGECHFFSLREPPDLATVTVETAVPQPAAR